MLAVLLLLTAAAFGLVIAAALFLGGGRARWRGTAGLSAVAFAGLVAALFYIAIEMSY